MRLCVSVVYVSEVCMGVCMCVCVGVCSVCAVFEVCVCVCGVCAVCAVYV